MRFKNLLPEDTRALELVSSWILLGLAMTQPLLLCLGLVSASLLILLAIYFNEYKLRTCMSLVAGAVFIQFTKDTTDVSVFFMLIALGISNLYAFLVNNQSSKWK